MSLNRVQQELKDRATLLGAGGDHRPDPLAPAAAFLAPRPLGDLPVDHHEANRLFGQVVRRLDARRGDEAEVRFPVLAEPFRQVLGVFRVLGTRVVAACSTCSRAASNAF